MGSRPSMNADTFHTYRRRVIWVGLAVSWVGLLAYAWLGWRTIGIDDPEVLGPLSVLGGCLVVLSLLPWERYLQRTRLGDGFVLVWSALAIAGVSLAEDLRDGDPLLIGFVLVVIFVAATLASPLTILLSAVMAGGGYWATLTGAPSDPTVQELSLQGVLYAASVLFVLILAGGVRRQLERATQRIGEATEREREVVAKEEELDRLYEVSRTIGVGSNLSEVLPELVGRVASAVKSKVGLALLYRTEHEMLEVMSPIWVAGHTLQAEGYELPLDEGGLAQRVFTSSEPIVANDLAATGYRDKLLVDLDVAKLVAVPLQIESKTIGVLMVGDKADGAFTQEDVATLQSLAGPSALVVNQMSRYEEAKETGQRMAEIAQLKTDFVSVVSHELRTPLTSIIGALKTLTRPELAPPDPNARELVSSAEKQANRLRALIEDLLVVSRLDNRALPVRPETLDVRTILTDIVNGIPGAARRVLVDISGDATHIEADVDHLRRILTNLIDNALKYAEGSSIEVTSRPSGSELWMSVVDHGPGIPYELHDHIFDRFTQVERSETRHKGGTGLGLSIVRGLAEAMGGRVWFEPTIGGGSTFTVALPRAPGPVAADRVVERGAL